MSKFDDQIIEEQFGSDYTIICDIDGVLAWIDHRLHYMKEKDYENFYSVASLSGDLPISAGKGLLKALQGPHAFKTVLVTGRPERTREATVNWLEKQGIFFDDLVMRKDGDYRPSPIVKVEAVTRILDSQWKFSDMNYYFIDDDPTNVEAVAGISMYITGITFGCGMFHKLKEENGKASIIQD